ncbi:MAG: alpha/beta family hydrolase [Gemmatimonadaceae bacterium]
MAIAFKTLWRRIRAIWLTLGALIFVVFTSWSLIAYRASPSARNALVSDSRVEVTRDGKSIRFVPAPSVGRSPVRLLFFPGALVDPVAYAPLARAAAESGCLAIILEVPKRGAFGGADDPELYRRARALVAGPVGVTRWVIAGHSRGGVIAVNLAAQQPPGLAGLVLIGTSHPRDVSLASLAVPVTKIVGTRDGLASPTEVRTNASLLPSSTRWVWIEGGNHSQFGWYGFQPGDRFAEISRDQQHHLTIQALVSALKAVESRQPE